MGSILLVDSDRLCRQVEVGALIGVAAKIRKTHLLQVPMTKPLILCLNINIHFCIPCTLLQVWPRAEWPRRFVWRVLLPSRPKGRKNVQGTISNHRRSPLRDNIVKEMPLIDSRRIDIDTRVFTIILFSLLLSFCRCRRRRRSGWCRRNFFSLLFCGRGRALHG